MSDVDEGSSDDSGIWENLPKKKHHVRGLGTKSKRTEVADQTRAQGSIWKDATDAFQLVVSEWVKEIHSKWGGQFGATHRLGYGGGKNGASGRCACDARHCKISEAKCKVGLEVKWRNPNDKTCVKIMYLAEFHDCKPRRPFVKRSSQKVGTRAEFRHAVAVVVELSAVAEPRLAVTCSGTCMRFGDTALVV